MLFSTVSSADKVDDSAGGLDLVSDRRVTCRRHKVFISTTSSAHSDNNDTIMTGCTAKCTGVNNLTLIYGFCVSADDEDDAGGRRRRRALYVTLSRLCKAWTTTMTKGNDDDDEEGRNKFRTEVDVEVF